MADSNEEIDFSDSLQIIVENLPHLFDPPDESIYSNYQDDENGVANHHTVKTLLENVLYDPSVQHLLVLCGLLDDYANGYLQPDVDTLYGKHILTEVMAMVTSISDSNNDADELSLLLRNPHLRNLLIAYDDICHRTYYPSIPLEERPTSSLAPSDSISMTSSRVSQRTPQSKSSQSFHAPSKQSSIKVTSPSSNQSNSISRRVNSVSGTSTPTTTQYRDVTFADDLTRGRSRSSTLRSTTSTEDRTPRVITISRDPSEPLGITVARVDSFVNGKLQSDILVERILLDSLVDRQDVLRVGDIIVAMNDMPVDSPESLQRILKETASPTLTLKIIPGPRKFLSFSQAKDRLKSYVRTFFSYNPINDTLLPTGNVGLSFEAGDILEVVDKSDPHYWQARRLGSSRIGLIPSSTLEERRKAFTPLDREPLQRNGTAPKKKTKKAKKLFRVVDAPVFSEFTDIWSYEDVVQIPAMPLKCLVLIGPSGVGRRSLKQLMCQMDPRKFGYPTPDTTQTSALSNGNPCHYISRGQMETDIKNGLYLEWAEINNELHGIRLQAVQDIISQGKTVVLDCQPTSVRTLRQPEFNPHVVFIAAPSVDVLRAMQRNGQNQGVDVTKRTDEDFRIIVDQSFQYERLYRHLYQSVFLNDNVALTAKRLINLVRRLERQPQWIPVAWEEEIAPQHQLSVATGAVSPILSLPTEDDRASNTRSGSIRSDASQSQRSSVAGGSRISSRMSNDRPRVTQQRSESYSSQRSNSSKVSSISNMTSPRALSQQSGVRSPPIDMVTAQHSVIVTSGSLRLTSPQVSVTNQKPLFNQTRHELSESESSSGSSTASSTSTPRGGSGSFLASHVHVPRANVPSSGNVSLTVTTKSVAHSQQRRPIETSSSSESSSEESSTDEDEYVQPKLVNQSRAM